MYRQRNNYRVRSVKKTIKSFNPSRLINDSRTTFVPKTPEHPITHRFEDFQIDPRLRDNVLKKNYTAPRAIQDQAIPPILEGRDVIGIANTGTGKTAAFLIPLINKALMNRNEKILIIAPTRELAVQIQEEFLSFSRSLSVYSVLAIGGSWIGNQINNLRRPFNFLIGTPGRLDDLVKQRAINLSTFQSVVLDEADHMVDIGFIKDIKYFIASHGSRSTDR